MTTCTSCGTYAHASETNDLDQCRVCVLRIALRGVVAALSQPKTYPADIEAAKAFAITALNETPGSWCETCDRDTRDCGGCR